MPTTDPGNERSKDGWIATYTGRRIEPLKPDFREIDPMDIAHSLANQCRFTGHVKEFYSTAQHSYLVSTIVPAEDALWGLLHDASETYLSDIASPVKRQLDFYREAEAILLEAVCKRFGLPVQMPESVHVADKMMLRAEQRDLMPNGPSEGEIYEEEVVPWAPSKAKSFFLRRYGELTGDVYEGYYPAEATGMMSGKLWRHLGTIKETSRATA